MIDNNKKPRYIRRKGDKNGAVYFIHPCCVCGDTNAPFGFGVRLQRYPRSLGRWYCKKDKPKTTIEKIK